MPSLKATLALSTTLFVASSTYSAAAEDAQADAPAAEQEAEAVQNGAIKGQMTMPPITPAWFKGGELSFTDAIVRIEGSYKSPKLPYPENFRQMTREEKKAWYDEFKTTEAYEVYREESLAAYNARPIFTFPVNADGSFEATGLVPNRYNVMALIPHADADADSVTRQSWASGFKQIVIGEEGQAINAGEIELKFQNVVMPGDTAPDWTAKQYDGSEIKLSDYHGKYVLLDFWATWCGPCIAELPNIKKAYEMFGDDSFEIIALSLDKTIDLPQKFHEENPSDYVHAYLGQWNKTETTARDYGVSGIPSIWLIGPDGKVVARDLRGEKLIEAIRDAVKGAPATN